MFAKEVHKLLGNRNLLTKKKDQLSQMVYKWFQMMNKWLSLGDELLFKYVNT